MYNIPSGFCIKRIKCTNTEVVIYETLEVSDTEKAFGLSELNECGNYFPSRG